MDKNERDMFLLSNRSSFRQEDIPVLDEILKYADTSVLSGVALIKPVSVVLISIFLGQFGADRFMLGDKMTGIVKLSILLLYYLLLSISIADEGNSSFSILVAITLLTSIAASLSFWLYDIFTSVKRAKIRNFDILTKATGYTRVDTPSAASDENTGRSYVTDIGNNNYNTSTRGSYQR